MIILQVNRASLDRLAKYVAGTLERLAYFKTEANQVTRMLRDTGYFTLITWINLSSQFKDVAPGPLSGINNSWTLFHAFVCLSFVLTIVMNLFDVRSKLIYFELHQFQL